MPIRGILAVIVIGGVAQLAPAPAAADVHKGPYAAVEGGAAWTASLSSTPYFYGCATFPAYPCGISYNAATFDLGYSAGVQVGYAFGGPRLEFEYNYRNNAANTIATADGTRSASGELTSNNFMVNALYDFDTGSKWVPYIGIGLGIADVNVNNIHASAPVTVGGYLDGSSSKFAAQFIVGVEYAMSDKVGVLVDWRGLWASSVRFNYGIGCPGGGTTACAQTGSTTYDYWNGALNIGLRVKF